MLSIPARPGERVRSSDPEQPLPIALAAVVIGGLSALGWAILISLGLAVRALL